MPRFLNRWVIRSELGIIKDILGIFEREIY